MKKIFIGGVPEHFNLPWNLAIEEGLFEKQNIELIWKDYPAGTGAMCEALRQEELDLAVILSEGIVRDIVIGNPTRIIQVYVKSPLLWGIHVAADSPYLHIEELKGSPAAISRYGSGSHLMAIVNAEKNDWDLESDLDFVIVEDLEGALKALPKGEGAYFLWEKFMTKPFVDEGVFRLIDETPTPWPSFVIAGREQFLSENVGAVKTILSIINKKTEDFKKISGIEKIIASRFDQKEEDVLEWLRLTEWSQNQLTNIQVIEIQKKLKELELISETVPSEENLKIL